MPGSATFVFSNPEDFEAELRAEGYLGLWITGHGSFRARLTRVILHRLRLSTAEEQLSRIAFISVPADMIMVSFPIGTGIGPIFGGIGIRPGEILTLGPGQLVHARTDANCRWGLICMPVKELVEFGSRLTGVPFAAPPFTQSWRPLPTAGKDLLRLHAIASRMAEFRPQPFVDAEAAHGLEQQLIHAVVECLSAGSGGVGTATARRHQDIMIRFERLLQAQPYREMRMTEICSALAVSDQLLRRLCAEHLGMAPVGYDRLRRMSLVRRILLRDNHYGTTVAEVARRYGFNDPGRLSSNYRAVFAETPFATLRRRSGRQSRRTGP